MKHLRHQVGHVIIHLDTTDMYYIYFMSGYAAVTVLRCRFLKTCTFPDICYAIALQRNKSSQIMIRIIRIQTERMSYMITLLRIRQQ